MWQKIKCWFRTYRDYLIIFEGYTNEKCTNRGNWIVKGWSCSKKDLQYVEKTLREKFNCDTIIVTNIVRLDND